MLRVLSRTSGFTLIELIVGMLIFSIGMTAVLALLSSTVDNALYSRHEIVASNILREEIELIKNIRNSNIRNFIPFESTKLTGNPSISLVEGSYVVENDYAIPLVGIDSSNGHILNMPITLSGVNI